MNKATERLLVAADPGRRGASWPVGFPGALFLLLLALKLGVGDTDVVNWSWWWVTAPLWGLFALALVLFSLSGIIRGMAATFGRR